MNCIIIDDEPLAIEGMQAHIENIPGLKLLGSFDNPLDAIPFLQQQVIDLIFLDINMPEINGLNFVKSLHNPPLVIFATAYPQYAIDSYELDAIDYLVKPVRLERFLKAVNKAQQYCNLLEQPEKNHSNEITNIDADYLYIKTDKKFVKILIKDILYIEGLKNYVVIQLKEKKILGSMNLKSIGDQLPAQQFARISRSFIVNTRHIDSFDSFCIYIRDNELPIGDSYKDYFFSTYIDGKVVRR
jgi:two-component system, LytTR family, response regulator